jgi:hypothetical protein
MCSIFTGMADSDEEADGIRQRILDGSQHECKSTLILYSRGL